MTKRVKEILSWYGSDNPGLSDESRPPVEPRKIRRHGENGHLARGSGVRARTSAQFLRQIRRRTIPGTTLELAVKSGCNAYAAPLGFLEAGVREFAGEVPLILKVNDHDVLLHETDPNQALTGSVSDALRLGCVGIGFTIYPGVRAPNRNVRANSGLCGRSQGLRFGRRYLVFIREDSGLSKEGETAIDVTGYAAHIAAQLGAHIVKVKLPSAHIEQDARPQGLRERESPD